MRVGMVLDKEYPPDVRVRREAQALIAEGHEVILLARNRDGRPREEHRDGMKVVRLPDLGRLGTRLSRWLTVPHPLNPWYAGAIASLLFRERVDVLHVHDLPLVATAEFLAAARSVPVVFDLHEDYPAMVEDRVTHPVGRLLFRRLGLLRLLERAALSNAAECLVVVDEQHGRLEKLGVDREHITTVPNVFDLEEFDRPPAGAPRHEGDAVIFLYTGLFAPARGLDLVLEALARVPADLPVHLLLVGDGKGRPALEAQVEALGLEQKVTFAGWQEREALARYMAGADVGLVPHRPNPHVQTTMPNKIYEFLAFGLPVITSSAGPLTRLTREAGCGLSVDVEDVDALAEAMTRMARDPELRGRFAEAGRRYVETRHNWQVLGAPAVASVYRRLLGAGADGVEAAPTGVDIDSGRRGS